MSVRERVWTAEEQEIVDSAGEECKDYFLWPWRAFRIIWLDQLVRMEKLSAANQDISFQLHSLLDISLSNLACHVSLMLSLSSFLKDNLIGIQQQTGLHETHSDCLHHHSFFSLWPKWFQLHVNTCRCLLHFVNVHCDVNMDTCISAPPWWPRPWKKLLAC